MRGTTLLVFVFVISLPEIVYSVDYLVHDEKFVFILKRWLWTNPRCGNPDFIILVILTIPPLGEVRYCVRVTEQ